jgi:hypothetical protein
MISLADLRARNVLPTWQEGVAVVQELLHTVIATQGSADRLPDLEHVALIANGDVVALPGSPAAQDPVRHLAILLQLLLEGVPAPPELTSFIESNVANPPQYPTVEEFSKQLAFFERPGRKADVERLVARGMTAEATSRADEELRRLKERASAAAEGAAKEEPASQSQPRRKMPLPVVAAAVFLATVAAGGVWWWQSSQAPASVTTAADGGDGQALAGAAPAQAAAKGGKETAKDAAAAAPHDDSLLGRTKDAVSRVVSSAIERITGPAEPAAESMPPQPTPEPKTERPRRRTTPPSATASNASAANTGAATPAATAVAVVATEVSGRVAPPSLAGETAVAADDAPPIVYTLHDPDVEPAVLVRPVLPKNPPPNVPPDQIGTVEVIVNEEGDVEQVKLISPANRFQERMLVSAAKMWKFRPATKDGHPVRFRARVRLTI